MRIPKLTSLHVLAGIIGLLALLFYGPTHWWFQIDCVAQINGTPSRQVHVYRSLLRHFLVIGHKPNHTPDLPIIISPYSEKVRIFPEYSCSGADNMNPALDGSVLFCSSTFVNSIDMTAGGIEVAPRLIKTAKFFEFTDFENNRIRVEPK